MRKFYVIGIALLAMFAFSAVAASSASAEGPFWIVLLLTAGEPLVQLKAGEEEAFTSSGGVFKLDGTENIECTSEQDTGKIIGGNPGTDESSIEFLGCHVEGLPNCIAENLAGGIIDTTVNSVLVYPDPEDRTKALDAFLPGNTTKGSDTFAKFTLKGTECRINGFEVTVNATGSEVTSPALNKKCGVLAWVGKLNASNIFELTLSGEEVLTGAIESAGTPTEAILLGTPTLITCKLEAFLATAEELGISEITLVSEDLFGWEA